MSESRKIKAASAHCADLKGEYIRICVWFWIGHVSPVELIVKKKGRKKKSKNTKGFANWRIKGRVAAMDLLSIWRYCKCDNSKN